MIRVMAQPRALFDKRFFLSIVLLVILAVGFWAGSRVPQLSDKATMGGDTQINAMGFETALDIQPTDPKLKQIAFTTVNWLDTNKKGMTFGVLFAAALMTLFSLLQGLTISSGFANSALGLLIGAPLGVCVNCAAPIARGLAAAGARIETALAAMVSSPTMNFIVLTMLFTIFPLYIAILKTGLSLLFILVGIPLICRFFLRKEMLQVAPQGPSLEGVQCDLPTSGADPAPSGWMDAGRWLFSNYRSRLWFIAKTTVPLMLLAAALGAVLITLMPWGSLADVIPQNSKLATLAGLFLVATIGVFLPVPMAFDVVVCSVLLAAGMPVRYVMVLLFTLGVFSIYSHMIVAAAVSRKAARIIFVTLVGIGVVSGVAAHEYEKIAVARNKRTFFEVVVNAPNLAEPTFRLTESTGSPSTTPVSSPAQVGQTASSIRPVQVWRAGALAIERLPFAPRNSGVRPFERLEGSQLGLTEPFALSFLKMFLPYSNGHGRGISTGDVDNDGWVDVLIIAEAGVSLYKNTQGSGFLRIPLPDILPDEATALTAALVDLSGDGWLDLVFSTDGQGNFVVYNHDGLFEQSRRVKLPHFDDAVITTALGFGDIDRDHDIDIVVGNWEAAWLDHQGDWQWMASERSHDFILRNDGGHFTLEMLPGVPGATMSVLLSDFSGDGVLDLIVANDYEAPDKFFIGNQSGEFRLLTHADGIIPVSTHETMSLAAADIDNDLDLEIFFGDVSYYPFGQEPIRAHVVDEVCEEIVDPAAMKQCTDDVERQQIWVRARTAQDPRKCQALEDADQQAQCVIAYFVRKPREIGVEVCDRLLEGWQHVRALCNSQFRWAYSPTETDLATSIPQRWFNNVLLTRTESGFEDIAADLGINYAGFSWNARFADLDNDEWQDLYVVNGWIDAVTRRESNYFFRNEGGERFVNATEEFGLTSFLATSAYSYIDWDNDGDLDIISVPVNGPLLAFRNNSHSGNSMIVDVRDRTGNNVFGLGGRVTIFYGPQEDRTQMREINASGGFVSFDEPAAHFGLGEYGEVARIRVDWPDGTVSDLAGPFEAGARYRIRRFKTGTLTGDGR